MRDIAEENDLGARTGARDQRLDLFRRQVLRFVDDQELVDEGAAAHEVERLDLDPRADQVLRRGAPPFAAVGVGLVQHLEVVVESAHPRRHLLFFGTGQETDVFTDRHGHARDNDLVVQLGLEHLRQTGRQRQQSFTGAGLAEQGDEIALRIHQQVQREILFAIARGDAPDVVLGMRKIAQRLQHGSLAVDLLDLTVERGFAIFRLGIDELVDQQ